jgi:hypothetical protein
MGLDGHAKHYSMFVMLFADMSLRAWVRPKSWLTEKLWPEWSQKSQGSRWSVASSKGMLNCRKCAFSSLVCRTVGFKIVAIAFLDQPCNFIQNCWLLKLRPWSSRCSNARCGRHWPPNARCGGHSHKDAWSGRLCGRIPEYEMMLGHDRRRDSRRSLQRFRILWP